MLDPRFKGESPQCSDRRRDAERNATGPPGSRVFYARPVAPPLPAPSTTWVSGIITRPARRAPGTPLPRPRPALRCASLPALHSPVRSGGRSVVVVSLRTAQKEKKKKKKKTQNRIPEAGSHDSVVKLTGKRKFLEFWFFCFLLLLPPSPGLSKPCVAALCTQRCQGPKKQINSLE